MTGITEALKCCLAAAALGGLSLPAVAAPAPEAFWSLVGKLAAATPQGAQAVARQWPGKPLAAAGAAQVSSAPWRWRRTCRPPLRKSAWPRTMPCS
ncbi:hypothetical protein ACFQOZ_18105 [Comamonas endophytica]|uniref:hypothetical protein n=1 Tax=Comamonas endophytica TaxID=2949090 RepID=UPI0036127278